MKVYVASKFEEAPRARAFMDKLENLGHTITYRWVNHEPNTPVDQLWECAENDLAGVVICDAFVLLWHPNLRGGLVELGAALALEKIVIVVGAPPPGEQPNVFFHDRSIRFVEHEDMVRLAE